MPASRSSTSRRKVADHLKQCLPVFAMYYGGGRCGDGIWERKDGELMLMRGSRSGRPRLTACALPRAVRWLARNDQGADIGGVEAARVRFLGRIARLLAAN